MANAAPTDEDGGGKEALSSYIGRRWRLLLLVVFLLVGGGLIYLFLGLGKDGQESEAGTLENTAVPNQEAAAEENSGVDLLVVPVRRFAVPLINADHDILGYMWVDLAFEVDGPQNQSYVAARLPALRDAFLRDLNTRQTTRKDRPGALDFSLLQKRLQTTTEKTVGKDRILKVRITNAVRVPG